MCCCLETAKQVLPFMVRHHYMVYSIEIFLSYLCEHSCKFLHFKDCCCQMGLPDYRVNGSLALQSTLFGRHGKACSDVPADKIAHYLARMHLRARC